MHSIIYVAVVTTSRFTASTKSQPCYKTGANQYCAVEIKSLSNFYLLCNIRYHKKYLSTFQHLLQYPFTMSHLHMYVSKHGRLPYVFNKQKHPKYEPIIALESKQKRVTNVVINLSLSTRLSDTTCARHVKISLHVILIDYYNYK